jgi:hypothetical protein
VEIRYDPPAVDENGFIEGNPKIKLNIGGFMLDGITLHGTKGRKTVIHRVWVEAMTIRGVALPVVDGDNVRLFTQSNLCDRTQDGKTRYCPECESDTSHLKTCSRWQSDADNPVVVGGAT